MPEILNLGVPLYTPENIDLALGTKSGRFMPPTVVFCTVHTGTLNWCFGVFLKNIHCYPEVLSLCAFTLVCTCIVHAISDPKSL